MPREKLSDAVGDQASQFAYGLAHRRQPWRDVAGGHHVVPAGHRDLSRHVDGAAAQRPHDGECEFVVRADQRVRLEFADEHRPGDARPLGLDRVARHRRAGGQAAFEVCLDEAPVPALDVGGQRRVADEQQRGPAVHVDQVARQVARAGQVLGREGVRGGVACDHHDGYLAADRIEGDLRHVGACLDREGVDAACQPAHRLVDVGAVLRQGDHDAGLACRGRRLEAAEQFGVVRAAQFVENKAEGLVGAGRQRAGRSRGDVVERLDRRHDAFAGGGGDHVGLAEHAGDGRDRHACRRGDLVDRVPAHLCHVALVSRSRPRSAGPVRAYCLMTTDHCTTGA